MSDNFLFIDDSGSKDWDTPYSQEFKDSPPSRTEQNLNFWRRNYFVLAGLHISKDLIKKINPAINQLKIDTFGTKKVEIKSTWLRNPKNRKKQYFDKFKIDSKKLLYFTEKWYELIIKHQNDLSLHAFVMDKRYFKRRNEFTPLQYLTQVLFDRVELFSSQNCTIVFDQMDREIKSVTHNQGQILKISNKEIDLGSFQRKYSHNKPKFEKSFNSNFLQLADSVAYNVWRQFVDHGDSWEDKKGKQLAMYPFFKKISNCFYTKDDGRVAGYGIIKVPDPIKKGWKRKL